jgi:hypothetical protein
VNEQMENLYYIIGQSIVNALSVEWSLAWIDAEIKIGISIVQGKYIMQGDTMPKSFAIDEDTIDTFEELQSLMKQQTDKKWRKAHFEMVPEGKFDLKFEY